MTTREEYTAAANEFDFIAEHTLSQNMKANSLLAARVLRALADGAVLCKKVHTRRRVNTDMYTVDVAYIPLDPQP
jgi:ribosomal protein S25